MEVKLPPLGEGVDSGSVVAILVKEGDQIAKGQGIIELETGKAVAPVPSPTAGKVTKIIVSVGDKISVGQPIASLEGGAGAPAVAKPAAAAPAAKPASRTASRPAPQPVQEEIPEEPTPEEEPDSNAPMPAAAPTLRRIARELGIDLRRIHGSDEGGRVVMNDLRAHVRRLQQLAAQPRSGGAAAPAKASAEQIDFSKWGSITKRPMTQLRKVISQRMSQNWNAIPHVTQFEFADITDLEALRKKNSAAYEKKGAKLTLTAMAVKIVAEALKKHPVFNTSLDETTNEVIYKEYFHIGLAVDTEQGLIVPVLRDADKKDIASISKEVNDLATRTRDRKVSMEELQGGTFTISNQGGIGGGHFTPIVNRPEVAILGTGRGALKPVVRDGKIESRLMLPLALSYDHRVIDGGAAVRFILDIVAGFEKFDEKLLG
ncbi:MAG TPA: 2-oxo acid dehydrogenase subunit E2 [Verrucomicrobiae bacterium]|jgi:pyruvate dehydrogenase E2 component (dihydrolipoamide acetyltransferase)